MITNAFTCAGSHLYRRREAIQYTASPSMYSTCKYMLYYTYIVHVHVHIYIHVEYPILHPGGDTVYYIAFNVENL